MNSQEPETPIRPQKSKRNLPIEGMRGFLAMSIVFYHVYEMAANNGWYPLFKAGTVWPVAGVYFVSLFFCISGFLIIQSLIAKNSVPKFLRNRAARIYPVFLLLHLIVFLFGPLLRYEWMASLRGHPIAWLENFFLNMFFLPGVFHLPIAQKNAWSLSYEALFYAASAGLFVAFKRSRNIGLLITIVLCSVAIVFRPLCVYFVVGYICFWIIDKGYQWTHGQVRKWVSILTLPAILVGAFVFSHSVLAAVPFVFLGFYGIALETGVVARALSSKPMVYVGRISYSLYLVHPFVLDPLRRLLSAHATPEVSRCTFPIIGVPLAVAVSVIFYLLIEQKFTRVFLKRESNDRVAVRGELNRETRMANMQEIDRCA